MRAAMSTCTPPSFAVPRTPSDVQKFKFQRARRLWDQSDLFLDGTCATRAAGDSDPNFENYDLFHAQSPDTGRGVHARSWRAKQKDDVRR